MSFHLTRNLQSLLAGILYLPVRVGRIRISVQGDEWSMLVVLVRPVSLLFLESFEAFGLFGKINVDIMKNFMKLSCKFFYRYGQMEEITDWLREHPFEPFAPLNSVKLLDLVVTVLHFLLQLTGCKDLCMLRPLVIDLKKKNMNVCYFDVIFM